jgi:short-subunit dehydrogenase
MDGNAAKLAVITGASRGIGEAFAHLLASDGLRLVVVGRNEGELNRVAGVVTARHSASVLPIVLDLGEPGAGAAFAEELARRGLEPDIVINNAGYGLLGRAAELPIKTQTAMVDLNVRTVTDLSLRFLPRMIEKRAGGIINVASLASYFPGPHMAVYYATKAYVLSFSEALASEVSGSGVTVTALCPGVVPTGFQARAGMDDLTAFRRVPKMSAEAVARAGWEGFLRRDRVVLPGAATALMAWTSRLTPRALLLPILRSVLNPDGARATG